MSRSARLLGVVVAMAATLVGPGGQPAKASPGPCQPNAVCVFRDINFAGCRYATSGNAPNEGSDFRIVHYDDCPKVSVNDSISSYHNNSPNWVAWWRDPDYNGDVFCAAPGASATVLSGFKNGHGNPNDIFSSVKVLDPKDPATPTDDQLKKYCAWIDYD